MNLKPEEIIIYFMSYAAIPFKAEICADNLFIEWGDGHHLSERENHSFTLSHNYLAEGIQKIHITGKNISYLNVSRLSLTQLDIISCPALECLDCSINELEELNLKGCPNLEELFCHSNNIKKLDVSFTPHLISLDASYNLLEQLILTGCNHLEELYCSYNHLIELDLTTCHSINHINFSNNFLDSYKINTLFNQLPLKIQAENALIDYLENPGFDFCCQQIIKTKNWH